MNFGFFMPIFGHCSSIVMISGFLMPFFRLCLGILMNFGFFGANFCALSFCSNDFWLFISLFFADAWVF
jgi:hypothetical protein